MRLLKTSAYVLILGVSVVPASLSRNQEKKNGTVCSPISNGVDVYWYWKDKPDEIFYDHNYNGPNAVAQGKKRMDQINACNSAVAFASNYPCPYPFNVWTSCPREKKK